MGIVHAEPPGGRFGADAQALPDLMRFIAGAAKEHGARVGPRDQHQPGLGFDETRQIVKIAVVAIGIVGVAVAHGLRRGGDDGHAAALGLHPVQDAAAACREGRNIVGGQAHGAGS